MIVQFQYDCAHCHSKLATFSIQAQHNRRSEKLENFAFAVCAVCDRPSMFWYTDDYRVSRGEPIYLMNVREYIAFPGNKFHIVTSWPQTIIDIPESVPDNVKHYYEQGVTNEGSENWDAAGAMFRKTMDVATKLLSPELSTKSLFSRIDILSSNGTITKDLAAWAHEVRIEGNSSVHDEQPECKEDVLAMHEFCRGFLLYAFTLPALITRRRSAV